MYLRAMLIAGTVLGSGGFALAQSSSFFSGLFGGKSEESPVDLKFRVDGGDEKTERLLRETSLISASLGEGRISGQDMLAAARADYARLLGVLYDDGYYSAVINIALDGVEAAQIAPLDAPETVKQIVVMVVTGKQFQFSRAAIAPLTPKSPISDEYRAGQPAGTGVIKSAAQSAVAAWRDYGYAKADVGGQQIVADHKQNTVDSQIEISPGVPVKFGKLNISGYERMEPRRLHKIAGFPEGEPFDPAEIDLVSKRLRRTGVFSAVTVEEAEFLGPDNTLDVNLTVVEQKPRRIGAGFEISNTEGAQLSAYWMHRNLLGGGEKLRFDAEISDIGADTSGKDAKITARIDRPATITADTTAYVEAELESRRDEDYDLDRGSIGVGFNHIFNDHLNADLAIKYEVSRVTDANGQTDFRVASFPTSVTWDKRDEPNNAKHGFYLNGQITPFKGFGVTGSGARTLGEGRTYYSIGEDDRFTFAGRARIGTIAGTKIAKTPRDYLFYSGGGGSVRGQPFESLGVTEIPGPTGPITTGGMSIANLNAELRWQFREKISLVLFADYGQVWAETGFSGNDGEHSGAGAGIRYDTPIGPLRFDIAAPTSGDTGSGAQFYLGLGQAF